MWIKMIKHKSKANKAANENVNNIFLLIRLIHVHLNEHEINLFWNKNYCIVGKSLKLSFYMISNWFGNWCAISHDVMVKNYFQLQLQYQQSNKLIPRVPKRQGGSRVTYQVTTCSCRLCPETMNLWRDKSKLKKSLL